MAKVSQILAQVETLIAAAQPRAADEQLRSLMNTMGDEELRSWEADLEVTIQRFLPKRRKALLRTLHERLRPPPPRRLREPEPAPAPDIDELRASFQDTLKDLEDHHIFQWSTFYRDALSTHLDCFVAEAQRVDTRPQLLEMIRTSVSAHTESLFNRYFVHRTGVQGDAHQHAREKTLNGLQRFLDLPIEFFTARDSSTQVDETRVLRLVSSTVIRGVLEGYAAVTLGGVTGRHFLSTSPQRWLHSALFLTGSDFDPVLECLEESELRAGLTSTLRPVSHALDELSERFPDYVPLPSLAQLNWKRRRLDASIQPPPYSAEPQLIDVQCYLEEGTVTKHDLELAATRGVGVVVAPLRADLQNVVDRDERLRGMVVSTSAARSQARVVAALDYAIYARRSPRAGEQPLQYNFAREFPLHNPFLTRYFHVYRSSVRELLRAFEKRNGVRLWCSVRRSGKTTACSDLDTTTGESIVVSQTCETTGQIPNGGRFYERFSDALLAKEQIAPDFFSSVVSEVSVDQSENATRVVFVLDEYETFFGHLRAAVAREPDLRYTIAQPLLDQMVAFTRDNLLVFLGQQPNAHYILMDQNQLSAYVEQDPFPLFTYSDDQLNGELPELIRKVLVQRASFDASFVAGINEETAGHPFLTVNLLVEFVEWLIEKKRPLGSLALDGGDVERFRRDRLRPKSISTSPEYVFFREAVAEALSSEARVNTPWLHGIYHCIRQLVRASPETARCSREDFERLVEKAHLPELGLDADLLLATGTRANFLEHDDANVWPKIRLLARIANVTRGRATP